MISNLLLLVGVLAYFLVVFCEASQPLEDYAIVIDAGSSGSRCFVFHITIDALDNRNVSSIPCGKVTPGLSSFSVVTHDAIAYMAPVLLTASSLIPDSFHSRTKVFIEATAGMRLLPEDTQEKLWHNLVHGLNARPDIPFVISQSNTGTIEGYHEAFYAVLASNYVGGSIDGNLQ
jgi:Golgi apyrase